MSPHNEKGKRVYLTREQIVLVQDALTRHTFYGMPDFDNPDGQPEWHAEQPIIETILRKLD